MTITQAPVQKKPLWQRLSISIESASALLTWALVSGSALYFMYGMEKLSDSALPIAAALFLTYIVLWLSLIRERPYKNDGRVRTIFLFLLFSTVVGIYFVVPFVYTAIFMVIWSAALPYFISARLAFMLSPLWSAVLWAVYEYHWGFSGMIVSALLFWTFNLFALVMVTTTIKEKNTRETVETINRELVSTQHLLSQAAEQAERVRIARNIHDLLGHHLTALTINLQVAGRQLDQLDTDNEQATQKQTIKDSIEQCHSLSKLLLSDVREAVSDIRDKSSIRLESAIKAISDRLPSIDITVDYPDNISIEDVTLADVLIKCIQESFTNSLKHGKASEVKVSFSQHSNHVQVAIQDNGNHTQSKQLKANKHVRDGLQKDIEIQRGNGLTGIEERLALVDGKAEFQRNEKGFLTMLSVPVMLHD
ncbi:histidine kinase [Alteromonas sp. W364]|uniref:histidine kinase n=1 Tax=Alteromonas sp. W364 TaxID=3075610 RepID=UPI002884BF5F|nr:histidine kinase [Alteromonas sp. W364]MDT0628999.1 histidine kinase [Alteromonas sp. W364]